jgi:hypothetical protein
VAIVSRLLKKDANERFQTPAELLDALQSWVQEPIAPPTNEELPRFSLAAVGPTTANRMNQPFSVAGSPSSATSLRQAYHKPASTSSGMAIPALPPPAATATPGSVWESLSQTETVAARSAQDTARSEPKPPPDGPRYGKRTQPVVQPWSRRRKALAVAVGILVVSLGAAVAIFRSPAEPTKPDVPVKTADYRQVYVTRGPAPEGAVAYKSIAEALRELSTKGSPGGTLTLLDERYEEQPFFLGRNDKLKDLTIETDAAKPPAIWTVTSSQAKTPSVLEVRGIEGLKLRNIIVDAGGQRDYAVSVLGGNPHLLLDRVTLRGGKVAGLRVSDGSDLPGLTPASLAGAADAAHALAFRQVRIVAANSSAGVVVRAAGKSLVQHLQFEDVQIEGPSRTAFLLDGPHQAITVSKARIFQVGSVVYASVPTAPDMLGSIRFTNSTFHSISEAAIEADSVLSAKAEVLFSRCYFAQSKAIAKGRELVKAPGLRLIDCARDAATSDDTSPVKVPVVNVIFPVPRPDDLATFLRYPKGSPLATFGPTKIAIGFPND